MSAIIGRNIRSGMRPGGFSNVLGVEHKKHARREISTAVIKAAADAMLLKRGIMPGTELMNNFATITERK